MRGAVRVSPGLFFVVLSLVALGVIIHATYDYSAPAAAPAAQAPAPSATFMFEEPDGVTDSRTARPVALALAVVLSLTAFARVVVAQLSARTLSPLVYIVVAALVLLCVYVIINPSILDGMGSLP